MRIRARERGQASVVLVGALVIGLAFTGLAVDGARLFTARRDLQNVADSAALAGRLGDRRGSLPGDRRE